jgi:glucuronokinase
MIRTKAYPRAALIGNPSDGFYGRTIAFTFSNFFAEVTLSANAQIELRDEHGQPSTYPSLSRLLTAVINHGYSDPFKLMQASIKKFVEYCESKSLTLDQRGFSIRSQSDIPYQVGLAGSSAIIIAVLRALMQHFKIEIDQPDLANLALSVETDELNIPGGLQDRVVQVYGGLVFMDFDQNLIEQRGYGQYEYLDYNALPNLYIAYGQTFLEGSEVFHSDIRERFSRGDPDVLEAVNVWKALTLEARAAILAGDEGALSNLMNRNFDLRARMYSISAANLEMIDITRSYGASSKFTGSGGAVIGCYGNENIYRKIEDRLSQCNVKVFKPNLIGPERLL